MYRILSVIGTRPEAIKMSPVIRELSAHPDLFESIVGVTGQHDELLRQVLDLFAIRPHFNLGVMRPDQDLSELTALILTGMRRVLSEITPDLILVQGDTATVFATALAAFYGKVRIGHVEAGLRTHDPAEPFPEEAHRRLTDHIADLLFAPTQGNRINLLHEGVQEERIHVTGNTVVDGLRQLLEEEDRLPGVVKHLPLKGPMILLTAHRRESFGRPLQDIFGAVRRLARAYPEIQFVYPVHPNPNVRGAAFTILSGFRNIHLMGPVDYLTFVQLMKRCLFLVTDSGGLQEEAPTLHKPVLILRSKTERPELVEAGGAMLVGTDPELIFSEACRLIENESHYQRMANVPNPFGDGAASQRITSAVADFLQGRGENRAGLPLGTIPSGREKPSEAAGA